MYNFIEWPLPTRYTSKHVWLYWEAGRHSIWNFLHFIYLHKSIMWLRQIAQLSTTISETKIVFQYTRAKLKRKNLPQDHSATAFHCQRDRRRKGRRGRGHKYYYGTKNFLSLFTLTFFTSNLFLSLTAGAGSTSIPSAMLVFRLSPNNDKENWVALLQTAQSAWGKNYAALSGNWDNRVLCTFNLHGC